MRIVVICTGGTIEKAYSEQSGQVQNLNGKIDRYLERLRLPGTHVETIRLMNKDSLEMTPDDRALILAAVKSKLPSGAPIVITHGTDTLVETGLFLQDKLDGLAVPIVFTGAMTPLGFEGSDGLQNLTESLIAAKLLGAGVYLAIHGEVFSIGQVRKDRELARFIRK
jgi:L-asparaginase